MRLPVAAQPLVRPVRRSADARPPVVTAAAGPAASCPAGGTGSARGADDWRGVPRAACAPAAWAAGGRADDMRPGLSAAAGAAGGRCGRGGRADLSVPAARPCLRAYRRRLRPTSDGRREGRGTAAKGIAYKNSGRSSPVQSALSRVAPGASAPLEIAWPFIAVTCVPACTSQLAIAACRCSKTAPSSARSCSLISASPALLPTPPSSVIWPRRARAAAADHIPPSRLLLLISPPPAADA
jgi:hypothetical protein